MFTLRRRSIMDSLTEMQTEQLCRWLLDPQLSYFQIMQNIKHEWKMRCGVRRLQKFYAEHVMPYLIKMRERAMMIATGYKNAMRLPASFHAVTMDALEHKAMSVCLNPGSSPKEMKVYLDLVMRWQEQKIRNEEVSLKLRRLTLLEEKQKRLEDVFQSRLSAAEIAERCRSIFKQNGTNGQTEVQEAERLPIGRAVTVPVAVD